MIYPIGWWSIGEGDEHSEYIWWLYFKNHFQYFGCWRNVAIIDDPWEPLREIDGYEGIEKIDIVILIHSFFKHPNTIIMKWYLMDMKHKYLEFP